MSDLKPNFELEKKLNRWAWAVSVVVLALVSTMHKLPKFLAGNDFSWLPPLYSTLNAMTAVLLLAALYFIKNGQTEKHRRTMNLAAVCSGLFLLGYVIYHFTYEDTKYGGEAGPVRTLYFFMLISHIILAGVILPFILFTYIRAYTNQFAKHKKMARWVYWVWLYVAVTGPILYGMIEPYYNF